MQNLQHIIRCAHCPNLMSSSREKKVLTESVSRLNFCTLLYYLYTLIMYNLWQEKSTEDLKQKVSCMKVLHVCKVGNNQGTVHLNSMLKKQLSTQSFEEPPQTFNPPWSFTLDGIWLSLSPELSNLSYPSHSHPLMDFKWTHWCRGKKIFGPHAANSGRDSLHTFWVSSVVPKRLSNALALFPFNRSMAAHVNPWSWNHVMATTTWSGQGWTFHPFIPYF